jgi:GTP-binding protein HflX
MDRSTTASHLGELIHLCTTIGIDVCGSMTVKRDQPKPKYLVGSGKANEIRERAEEAGADSIIFDDDLSASQQRNWEGLTGKVITDRRAIILEIFSRHASTRESSLQVELAKLEYDLPRLKRAWTHLSRQRGGARGTRGEGETQLEVDRRLVLKRIAHIKEELAKVTSNRAVQRKQRESVPVPTGSFVGYTNAGKSSLLNALTGSEVMVKNKLFATLDATTRKVEIRNGHNVLLTDTVGFIRKLPHTLVDAFRSTLEETLLADFLVHVIDASNPEWEEHYETTLQVLEELGATGKPIITVFNKIDKHPSFLDLDMLSMRFPEALFVSAQTGEGLEELITRIGVQATSTYNRVTLSLPLDRHDLVAFVYRSSQVIRKAYVDHHVELVADVSGKTEKTLKDYIVGTHA